jgi:hypothetical protein
MDFRMSMAGLAVVALASFGLSSAVRAQPNCNSCVPAYEACVASGATDCDTRYAVCLRFCPVLASATPAGKPAALPADRKVNGKQEETRLVAAVSPH